MAPMQTVLSPGRLFITGASGSGSTTLGRAIADRWAVPHADVDDYFWKPTSPPYKEKRAESERLSLMNAVFLPRDAWVLSGSVIGWGDCLTDKLDAVVFLTVDPLTRMSRLRMRQEARLGGDTINPGGINEAAHQEFLAWAQGYDQPGFAGRSRRSQEEWLATLSCPIVRLDSAEPVPHLLQKLTGQP